MIHKQLKIPDCIKQHMIVYDPDGSIQCKERICSCHECLQGHLTECKTEKVKLYKIITCDDTDDEDEENYNEDEDEHEENELPREAYFDMIQAGTFIAIYSYENSPEPFYICKVIKSDIATENSFDGVEHVESGNKYLLCNYVEKIKKFEDKCTIN